MTAVTSSSVLRPVVALGLACAWTLASFGAVLSPAAAETNNSNFYKAELQQPLQKSQNGAIGGTYWRCEGSDCSGVKSGSSPVRVCQRLAKRHGPVKSFTHKGKALDAAKLAKCNAE